MTTEQNTGIHKEAYGVTLKLREAGQFTNNDGELIEYDKAIVISNGKIDMKVTAFQMAALDSFLKDESVRKELKKRFEEEKKDIQEIGF